MSESLGFAYVQVNGSRFSVSEHSSYYTVKCATQVDVVVQKESRMITGKGARNYADVIRQAVSEYLRKQYHERKGERK